MDLARTQQLLSRAALLADSARVRIERSASVLCTPLTCSRVEPTAPASVILLSRGSRGSVEQRDTAAPPPA